MPGFFVAIEGLDASGKQTQSKILVDRLHGELLSFPAYKTPTGQLIAEHLQTSWVSAYIAKSPEETTKLDAFVLQSLMLTNRMEFAPFIKRTLAENTNLVCDRYWSSGYAYGKADGLDGDYLLKIHEALPQPDLQLLIDIDIEDSIARRPERRDRYEKNAALLTVVGKYYRELWAAKGWPVINGRKTIEEVSDEIWKEVVKCQQQSA